MYKFENKEIKNRMKIGNFFRIYTIFFLFFISTGVTYGQKPVEKIGEDGLLYVPDENILPVISAALTSDEKTIAVRLNRKIWLYSLNVLKPINSMEFVGGGRVGGEIALSPNDQLIACGDREGNFWVWSTKSGKLIESKRGFSKEGSGMEYIHSISFSNDGNYLAIGNAGTEVFIWDTNSWKQIQLFKHHGNAVNVKFSHDNKYLGVATGDISLSNAGRMEGKLTIWDWKANHSLLEIFTGGVLATAIAFSPDGKVVASGNTNGDIVLWRISDGSLVTRLKGHKDRIFDLSFSSNGQLLASASEDQSAVIWDLRQSKLLNKLPHNERVLNVIFWQNNSALITSDKKGINFWNISDGKKLGRLLALESGEFVIFTSEGYFETDAPDYLRTFGQGNQQDTLKKTLHQRNLVLKMTGANNNGD